jgi:LysM repeat protein
VRIIILLVLAAAIFGSAGYFSWYLFVKPEEELRLEKQLPPPPPPPDPTVPDFNRAVDVQKSGDLPAAKAALSDFVDRYPESTKLDEAKNRLGEINTTLFFSKSPGPNKQVYVVKSGDVISRVANRNKTTPELLMRVNGLNTIMLRIGQQLMIPTTQFSLTIDRRARKVVLLDRTKFFKQYAMLPEPPAPASAKKAAPTPANARQPKVTGSVRDKISWLDGSRVTFADKGFENADHWIVIQPSGNSLYTDRELSGDEKKLQKPPGGGYPMPPDAMHELAALLSKNTPVSIE